MLSFHPKYTVMIYRQRNDFDEWLFIFSLLVSVTFPLALLTVDVHSLSRPHLPHSGSSTQLAVRGVPEADFYLSRNISCRGQILSTTTH